MVLRVAGGLEVIVGYTDQRQFFYNRPTEMAPGEALGVYQTVMLTRAARQVCGWLGGG